MKYLIEMNVAGAWVVWEIFDDQNVAERAVQQLRKYHPRNDWRLKTEEQQRTEIDKIRDILKRKIKVRTKDDDDFSC
jgi:hypothetical protein